MLNYLHCGGLGANVAVSGVVVNIFTIFAGNAMVVVVVAGADVVAGGSLFDGI